jgi:hypothetical protein
MEMSGQLHAPAALPPRKTPRTHWIGGRVGPQSRSGRYGVEINLAPAGNRTPAVQPVAIPIELSRFCTNYPFKIVLVTIHVPPALTIKILQFAVYGYLIIKPGYLSKQH